MEKLKFERCLITFIFFNNLDVITTSGEEPFDVIIDEEEEQ